MGSPLNYKRRSMTKLELFRLMSWLEKRAESPMPRTVRQVVEEAEEAIGHKVTDYHVRSALEDLGISLDKTESAKDELLARVKRIEKFMATYFAEEWGSGFDLKGK